MWLTDTSVRRPVLATVINFLLVVFGLFGLANTSVREYPDIDPPIVSIRTDYPGATAAIVETQITQLIEDRIAGIEGVKRINSSSSEGSSRITIEFELSRDIDAAANDVRDRVSRVLGNLPDQADPPEVSKADSDARAIMWLVLSSDRMSRLELTDYADRYLQDRFATLDGVSEIRLGGARRYAMRIWLDREAMAGRGLTAADIESALRSQNIERPAGRIESTRREFTLRTTRPYSSVADFSELVVATGGDGFPVRLGQVARIEVGAEDERGDFRANGAPTQGLGIIKQSKANTLAVAQAVRAEVAALATQLPAGMKLEVNYDSSDFVAASMREVSMSLLYAAAAVVAVIFVFLGSARAALVPAVTVPISLIASFILVYAFGFSINILTLLALVLAIGLVVDDAIVMTENIHRRLTLGEPPLLAAYRGAREVGFAVVATTVVLIAVFVPIAFLEGSVGRLFREFSLALAAAVACSSIVALTLSPVLASLLLRSHEREGSFADRVNRVIEHVTGVYRRSLERVLRARWVPVMALLGLTGALALLLVELHSELTPTEDRGGFYVRVTTPEGASFGYTMEVMDTLEAQLLEHVGGGEIERVLARVPGFGSASEVNSGIMIVTLAPWEARTRSALAISADIGRQIGDIPGARVVIQQRSGLGQRAGQPVQIVIGGPDYDTLAAWRDRILERIARDNPRLLRPDSDYKETKPEIELRVDIDRAADLGISVAAIAQTLETFFSGRRVTTYQDRGEEYDVILQAPPEDRRTPDALNAAYVRTGSGELTDLSNVLTRTETAGAPAYLRVDRLRAITITAGLEAGYPLGDALAYLESVVREELPASARLSYAGESLEFKESGRALWLSFLMALLIVYLVLAAQFESFVHPLVILTTVPLALFGALFGLYVLGMTLNIYSQIGLVMLVGLAAKNGILIVEFANQRRDAGLAFRDALIEASAVRLRPVLMTTLSTLAGAVPLMLASGAGAEARRILGVVVFFGVAFSALLTLYVVPAFYDLMARGTGSPDRNARRLQLAERAMSRRSEDADAAQ